MKRRIINKSQNNGDDSRTVPADFPPASELVEHPGRVSELVEHPGRVAFDIKLTRGELELIYALLDQFRPSPIAPNTASQFVLAASLGERFRSALLRSNESKEA